MPEHHVLFPPLCWCGLLWSDAYWRGQRRLVPMLYQSLIITYNGG